MLASPSQCVYPASTMAKSLLDVWLSGDQSRLRMELDRVTRMPMSPDNDDESDRIELLKSMAERMRETSDLFAPRRESPHVGTWLDLLNHLSEGDAALG